MPIENVKCPDCNSPMVSRKSKFGVYWGCSNYPVCMGTRDNMGDSREDRQKKRDEEDEE